MIGKKPSLYRSNARYLCRQVVLLPALSLQLLGLRDVIKLKIIKSFINRSLLLITLNIFQKKSTKGSGDHIKALAKLVGCSEKSHTKFEEMVHANYETLFHDEPETSPIVLLEKLTNKISKNSVLMVSCQY